MKYAALCCLSLFMVAWGLTPPAFAQSPNETFTDTDIARAIERGMDYLWSLRRDDGSWPGYTVGDPNDPNRRVFDTGPTALAMYALLESGVSPQEDRMAKSLEWLAANRSRDVMNYSVSLRANVWALANNQTDGKYVKLLNEDVDLLIRSTTNGWYDYKLDPQNPFKWGDNSNSQFAVLGAWAGKRSDLEIPAGYWMTVMNHWMNVQNHDGGWDYKDWGGSYGSMTAGGVATLYVCFDALFSDAFVRCNANHDVEMRAIDNGLKWLSREFERSLKRPKGHEGSHFYYYMYTIERAGLASGYKYFGTVDWFQAGASRILAKQKDNGGWEESLARTAFAMLFLQRGRHPVLFNKLKFDADWNNRPRDLANVTRWLSRNFEGTVNWQIVTLGSPAADWHDAPLLYLSASRAPDFTDDHIQQLRDYALQGGTILSITECRGSSFSGGMARAYAQMFPEYELEDVPADHPLNTIQFQTGKRAKLKWITNGIRPLAIHCDEDLPLAWQQNRSSSERWAFDTIANLYLYTTDKGNMRYRGVKLWPDPVTLTTPKKTVKIVRVKYGGVWNPEPLALERFARQMANDYQVKVEVLEPVDPEGLAESGAQVALMTGIGELNLTKAQKDALKAYADTQGLLIIDAAGGAEDFYRSARRVLDDLYTASQFKPLPADAPLYTVPEMAIRGFEYRGKAKARHPGGVAALDGVMVDGKLRLIFSREDMTAALVGYECFGIDGYRPADAFAIVRNACMIASP